MQSSHRKELGVVWTFHPLADRRAKLADRVVGTPPPTNTPDRPQSDVEAKTGRIPRAQAGARLSGSRSGADETLITLGPA
jgi:hypothetical protein